MAVTIQDSTEYTVQSSRSQDKQNAFTIGGKTRRSFFSFTQSGAGDAGSLANLVKLPAGAVKVLGAWLNADAMGSSRTLDFGHGGYTDMDGDSQAADRDAFKADIDVSSAVDAFQPFNAAGQMGVEITSKDGFVVSAQVNDASLPDTTKIFGYVEFVSAQ